MNFYITSPIYYVNARPHLGHSYTTILNDVVTRFYKLIGYQTHFLTGTDEHGDKIVQAAQQAGLNPKEYADQISAMFRATWPRLDIQNDDFIRTTEERHLKTVAQFLNLVRDKDDIYFDEYGGKYCFGCERFYTDKELVEGKCPDHQVEPQYIREANYFFRMSNYQDWLIDHIKKNPDFIRPERYRNEVLGFLREPLEDLCISRPKSRLNWGIDLPFDDRFVTYVWFDALISYLSGLGWPDGPLYHKFWPSAQHTIAKDILKPHAIFWPAMLRSAEIPIYQHLNVHGYWKIGASKMSKSVGNVVEALQMADVYGVEPYRYFLMRDMVFGLDSDFLEEALVTRLNSDLANDLGNLVQRTVSMVEKFSRGEVPAAESVRRESGPLSLAAVDTISDYLAAFKDFMPHKALTAIWELIGRANKFIDSEAPWALAKDPAKDKHLEGVMYQLLETVALVGALVWPVLPKTGENIWARLSLGPMTNNFQFSSLRSALKPGLKVNQGPALFPRVEIGGQEAATKASGERPVAAKPAATARPARQSREPAAEISFEDFQRLDLRVAEVISAEPVPKSEKLLKLIVRLGEDEERQIVSGIAKHFQPEELVGKQVVIVANLAPVKLMGLVSQGMILSASSGESKERLGLLTPSLIMPSGAKIS